MEARHTTQIYNHLEKQNELLNDARESIQQELHKLTIEEEMLMRKCYEIMSTHGLNNKKTDSGSVSGSNEEGQSTAAVCVDDDG